MERKSTKIEEIVEQSKKRRLLFTNEHVQNICRMNVSIFVITLGIIFATAIRFSAHRNLIFFSIFIVCVKIGLRAFHFA